MNRATATMLAGAGVAAALGAMAVRRKRRYLPRWLARLMSSLGVHAHRDPFDGITYMEMADVRTKHMYSRLTLFYKDEPLCIVRGEGQYLYDDQGRRYLDCVNNVAHIGHAHPRLAQVAYEQLSLINTNTRYHHPGRSRYAKKLLAQFPPELDTVFFVNSGSEANDLALRLARAYTSKHDVVVLDSAYHGHTALLDHMSPYKHTGARTINDDDDWHPAEFVHIVPTPDTYRGHYSGPDAGKMYGQTVRDAVEAAAARGMGVAAFFAETVLACGGQVVLPEGYLKEAYAAIRAHGGVCVADEVQTGFGRAGTHFWAFQTQGVVPDICTVGKPIANGYPLAAVVTRREIAEALDSSYFNTFGGSNLAMAMGEATLDILLEDRLQAQALRVSKHLVRRLCSLQATHKMIGDVRSLGLMLGVELVADRDTRTPAPEAAAYVLKRAREMGVHIQVDGMHENILKFKPPMVFTEANANTLAHVIDVALREYESMADDGVSFTITDRDNEAGSTTLGMSTTLKKCEGLKGAISRVSKSGATRVSMARAPAPALTGDVAA